MIIPCITAVPQGWVIVEERNDGKAYRNNWGLLVIVSINTEHDGNQWLHFSISHRKRIPTWDELKTTKFTFLGDAKAILILPSKSEYVNIDDRVLHLFVCLDKDLLPDFTQGSGSI